MGRTAAENLESPLAKGADVVVKQYVSIGTGNHLAWGRLYRGTLRPVPDGMERAGRRLGSAFSRRSPDSGAGERLDRIKEDRPWQRQD